MREDVQVRHAPAQQRFATVVDGVEAVLDYQQRAGVLRLIHTGVPPQIGGRGVAGELARAALDYARSNGLKVVPVCSYVAGYIDRHPQYRDLLAGDAAP